MGTADIKTEYMETAKEIREGFGTSDAVRDSGLKRPDDVAWENDISYGLHSVWNLLDIYYPRGEERLFPTIISIHGGAWIYGTKEVYQFYGCSLAQRGFTVVNFNYRLAPEHPFPSAVEDINEVFKWIKEHGTEHHIDLDNLFVVGDSAGAQLCAQYMAMRSNPSFAKMFESAGYAIHIPEFTVRAIALNCGRYHMTEGDDSQMQRIFRAYFHGEPEKFKKFTDTMSYLNESFPPTFVMSAYHDFLYAEAEPMTTALQNAGVEAECHIYGSPDKEEIGHVFHCNMKLDEAKKCNDDECAFFRKHMK